MADERTCPTFGTGSVDFNAFHDAIEGKDADLDAALDAATLRVDTPTEPTSLAGKTKAELLEIAAAEGATIADPKAKNDDLIAEIEAHRAGVLPITEQPAADAGTANEPATLPAGDSGAVA